MSNKAINWAWKMRVSPGAKLVLIYLADCANTKRGETCFPGINKIAENTGLSRVSVIRHLKELTKLNLVFKKKRYDNRGHRKSNSYQINLEYQPNLSNKLTPSLSINMTPRDDKPKYQSDKPKYQSDTLVYIEPKEEPKDICKVSTSSSIKNIFEHWKKTLGHPNAKLDGKRKAISERALKLGYSEDELKTAIEGCAKNPFNMGENDNNTKYDDIELILRDAKHIEGFIDDYKNPPKSKSTGAVNDPWAGAI